MKLNISKQIRTTMYLIFITMISLMILVACGDNGAEPAPNGGETPGVENGTVDNGGVGDEINGENGTNGDTIVDPTPDVETKTVTIYFINNEYVVTGNPELEAVIPVEVQVNIGAKSLVERVVEKLQQEPEDTNLMTELDRLTILSVESANDTAFVNFSREGLNGGSMQEGLVLTQLVNTLTDLEGINKVQILVEGSKAETLMGHYMIDEPLIRE
ncbi:GerMN domain-containing protein [Desulfuribacillus alkaliarsenatis]|uniref:GerMN domain-containing protein n=1 Tax=Desulfuribacillus alkaliarsenatis TaxID=766136 RepID=A0A1E5G121_9FIRM|nr:GerMN domain-containing protein [Desulfuribacillus alkaliarsenatis]OEF96606.1 hypothetical protein BHF68_08160 [Desulfuribacillus alkaliarsenatis]